MWIICLLPLGVYLAWVKVIRPTTPNEIGRDSGAKE